MSRKTIKIGWILSGNRYIAGARLQGFLMHEEFVRRGIDSAILHFPEHYDTSVSFTEKDADSWVAKGFTCIIFQKVCSGEAERLVRRLRALGVRTIYIACNLQGKNMVDACDATIAVSTFLKRAFGAANQRKIMMIEDPVEVPEDVFKKDYSSVGTRLRAVYVAGDPPSPYLLHLAAASDLPIELTEISGPVSYSSPASDESAKVCSPVSSGQSTIQKATRLIRELSVSDWGWKLRWTIFRKREAHRIAKFHGNVTPDINHVDWNLETVYRYVLEADMAVIPCELQYEWSLAKSGNRLLMFMALGMPVIASPLPAYIELIREAGGEGWMIARTPLDWRIAHAGWRNEQTRRDLGSCFRLFAQNHYGVKSVADKYLQVIH